MLNKAIRSLFLISTTVTVIINYLATGLPLNNITTGEISDIYYTVITPAGFTFSIWALIYLGLIITSLLILSNKFQVTKAAIIYFLISCVVNCLWIFSWHYFQVGLSAILLFLLVLLNYKVYTELNKSQNSTVRTIVTSWYLLYLGWTIIASAINITTFLQYKAGLNNLDPFIQGVFGGCVLVLAFLINSIISIKHKNFTTLAVLIWAALGILADHAYNTVLSITIYTLISLSIITIAKIIYIYSARTVTNK
ncbi:MAG: hypothetical protein AAGF07_02650 [Patescibacteria group bacterium]